MIRVFTGPLIQLVYDVLVPQQRKSISEIFRSLLHAILLTCIVVVVTQQVSLLSDLYGQKTEEYERAYKLYSEECPYHGSSPARLRECSELNIIINTLPILRAISHLVKGWNSCLYMPCSDLAYGIANNLFYKVLFFCVGLAMLSYAFSFFRWGNSKTKAWGDKYRYKETIKAMEKRNAAMRAQNPDCAVPSRSSSTTTSSYDDEEEYYS